MQLHLVDMDPSVVSAWRLAFSPFSEVLIDHADILLVARNTIVSPANSFGFMDGGIDVAYIDFFGRAIQSATQEAIERRPGGQLPVGASLAVYTGHERIPFMIVAPTMVMPGPVRADNAYRAFRAVLRIAESDPKVGEYVYCPGMATGVGGVPPEDAAEEMARAYRDWKSQ